MDKKAAAVPTLSETVTKMVALLEPLESRARRRAITASLTILGESSPNGNSSETPPIPPDGSAIHKDENAAGGLNPRARLWMKQYGVKVEQLEEIFDLSTGEIIGAVPGKSAREQVQSAYVLVGLGRLFSSGEPTFDDESARKVCDHAGCYDKTNHAKSMKTIGNLLTGAKDKGWKLTSPGLRYAAELIKQENTKAQK